MPNNLRPGQIAILAGGAVAFVFSFLDFFKFEFDGESEGWNAWSSIGDDSFGLMPLTIWPALFGLILAGMLAARTFGNADLPGEIAGIPMKFVNIVLAFPAALIMVSCLIISPEIGGADLDKGIGFWLMLLGSIALLVGAFMELKEDGATTGSAGGSAAPPSPF